MRTCPYCERKFSLMAAFVDHLVSDRLAIERRGGQGAAMFKSSPADARKPMCKYQAQERAKRITWNKGRADQEAAVGRAIDRMSTGEWV